MCRCQEVNLPDLAMCHAHSVSCHLRPRASAKEPDSEPDNFWTQFADTFFSRESVTAPDSEPSTTEAHRADRRSNVHQGFELLSRSKPSCVAQNLDAHLSDCQPPAIDPVVRPLRRSCARCRRRRPAMQVLFCRCQARARISSCLRCRRSPGVHAVRDRVPVGRGCSRQNRLRCFEGGAVLIRQRPSRHCSWGPARRFARQRRAACGIEIGVGHDCRFSRQRLCRLAALFAGCSSPPHRVCAVCRSAARHAAA